MEKRDAIIKAIKRNWTSHDIADVWNLVCEQNKPLEDKVYPMNEFEDYAQNIVSRDGIFSLLNRISGDFDIYDDWWWVNGYGNIYSTNDLECATCPIIDFGEIADYIIDYGDAGLPEITDDLLDEFIGTFFGGDDNARGVAEEIISTDYFDLVTDDWGDLELSTKIKLSGKENDDE